MDDLPGTLPIQDGRVFYWNVWPKLPLFDAFLRQTMEALSLNCKVETRSEAGFSLLEGNLNMGWSRKDDAVDFRASYVFEVDTTVPQNALELELSPACSGRVDGVSPARRVFAGDGEGQADAGNGRQIRIGPV